METREPTVMKKGCILIAVLLTLVFIPQLLNSRIGQKVIFAKIAKNIQYPIKGDKVHFSWMGPQILEGIEVTYPDGMQYQFSKISLNVPLWQLYKKIAFIGITQIFNPTITIPRSDKEWNDQYRLLDSILAMDKKKYLSTFCKILGEIHCTNAQIHISEWENSIDLPKLHYISNQGKIRIQADIRFSNHAPISHIDIECTDHTYNFKLQGKNIPTDLLDFFPSLWNKNSIKKVLGSTVNIDCSAQLINQSGPIFLDLYSSTFSLSQSGILYRDHYLLDKPLTITMQISDTIVNTMFASDILQVDRISSPVTITISPQIFPLPFSTPIEIKKGLIHLGTIRCRNRNLLVSLTTTILGIHDSKIELCFSEFPFCYIDETLHIPRLEVIVQNNYPIAICGKIDCFHKKVNLTLALMESTLRKVFRIPSLLPDTVITCPIKGNFDDIQLNVRKLIKRLLLLIAKEKTKKQLCTAGVIIFEKQTTTSSPL